MTVASTDTLYVEPFTGDSGHWTPDDPDDSNTTAVYAIPVADRMLWVYLHWDADTTAEQLQAARASVASLQVEPHDQQGIRINFTLERGCDTG